MGSFSMLKVVLLIMLFYSFSISAISYSLPEDTLQFVSIFNDFEGNNVSMEYFGDEIESNLQSQTDMPVIELGSLVFYSGNLFIDLVLNFFFAIPQMITILLKGLFTLFNIDNQLAYLFQTFLSVAFGAFYVLGLIQLLLNIRSGRDVT